jgi:hypothetical protein
MLYCQNLLEDLKVDLITESKNKVFIIHAAFEEHRLAAVVPRNCWIGDGFRTVGKRNGTVVVGEDALANLEFAWSQTNSVDENWFESSDFCTANMEGVEGIRSTSPYITASSMSSPSVAGIWPARRTLKRFGITFSAITRR